MDESAKPESTGAAPASPPASQPARPPRSRFRRWTRRIFKVSAVLFIALVIASIGLRTYYRVVGHGELRAAQAKLDAEEPGWQIGDLQTSREKTRPPENENSAPVVAWVYTLIPNSWQFFAEVRSKSDPDEPRPRNRKLPPSELLIGPHDMAEFQLRAWERLNNRHTEEPATLDKLAESTELARALGLTLRTMPRGYRAIEFKDDPLDVSMEPIDGARRLAKLMWDDAMLAAHSGEPVRGLQAAQAGLNVGRSIGDEPHLISQLVRAACGLVAADATARVLGLTDPKNALDELNDLQRAMLAEAEEPILLVAMRAERAVMHMMFENTDNAKLASFFSAYGKSNEAHSRTERLGRWYLDGFFHRDHAKFLELSSKAVAVAKLPSHQQMEGMQHIKEEIKALRNGTWNRFSYWRCCLFLPAFEKMTESTLRHKAVMATTATAIACERFRLTRGRWPKSLDEIPKDILSTVPLDPFTGKALTLTPLDDGIAVCLVGVEGKGFGGEKPDTGPLGGSDIGCRLYDTKLRGLPPPPDPPTLKDENDP